MSPARKPADGQGASRPDRSDSRRELIDATIEVILRDGIDAVRIDEVCERVGVTKGSLYWHFRDRTGLIREALLEHMRRLSAAQMEVLNDAVEDFRTREEYLIEIAGAFVDPFDPGEVEDRWQRLELIATSRRDGEMAEVMAEIQRRHQRYLTDLMEMASARGILRPDVDPTAMAGMVMVVAMGSNLLSLLGDDGPDADDWTRLLLVVIESLFPPEGSSPHH